MKTLDRLYQKANLDKTTTPLKKLEAICEYLASQGISVRGLLVREPNGSSRVHNSGQSELDVLRTAEGLYKDLASRMVAAT